ncbi:MAG: DEAD/DEAH box helicase [Candidatus Methylacidiphilales bacterium]|nr:DEAD/DEAH box helicase [Candidatus Methylacidiphilales bacterium]
MNTSTTLPSITFSVLQLAEPIQRALVEKNYTQPSPIQAKAIPHLLEGKDLIGLAQTGTGKTAAFALPILHRLHTDGEARVPRRPHALILTPTRELAIQIGESFTAYGRHLKLRHAVVFGGVGQGAQDQALRNGVDILIATPGRLLDLEQQGLVRFDAVRIFVLDEADRMLDMGFVHDVKKVMAKLPPKRQSLLFSATMPDAIRDIASSLLHHPVRVEVAPVSSTAERIEQKVCHVDKSNKIPLLVHLLREHPEGLVLVFSRTKHGSNKLADQLEKQSIKAEVIHGNKSQNARQGALARFKSGEARVLVATDIAARGIDVKGITLVVNFDIPNESETYVHRIGRTARAGAEGLAVAFCDPEERSWLRDIQRLIRKEIPILEGHPFATTVPLHIIPPAPPVGRGSQGGRGQRPSGGRGRTTEGGRQHQGGSRHGRKGQVGRAFSHRGGGSGGDYRPSREASSPAPAAEKSGGFMGRSLRQVSRFMGGR